MRTCTRAGTRRKGTPATSKRTGVRTHEQAQPWSALRGTLALRPTRACVPGERATPVRRRSGRVRTQSVHNARARNYAPRKIAKYELFELHRYVAIQEHARTEPIGGRSVSLRHRRREGGCASEPGLGMGIPLAVRRPRLVKASEIAAWEAEGYASRHPGRLPVLLSALPSRQTRRNAPRSSLSEGPCEG